MNFVNFGEIRLFVLLNSVCNRYLVGHWLVLEHLVVRRFVRSCVLQLRYFALLLHFYHFLKHVLALALVERYDVLHFKLSVLAGHPNLRYLFGLG